MDKNTQNIISNQEQVHLENSEILGTLEENPIAKQNNAAVTAMGSTMGATDEEGPARSTADGGSIYIDGIQEIKARQSLPDQNLAVASLENEKELKVCPEENAFEIEDQGHKYFFPVRRPESSDASSDASSLQKASKPKNTISKHRYFYGKFTRTEKNLFYFFVTLNILLAIIIPVAYCWIIPAIIQSCINDLGLHSSSLFVLRNFQLVDFKDNSLDVNVNLTIPTPVPLPVRAGLGLSPVRVTDGDGNLIATTSCPVLDFWVDRPIAVDVNTNVFFNPEAQENVNRLMGQLSRGVSDLKLVIHIKAPITFFGLTIYSGLDLYKVLDLGQLESRLESLVGLLDRIAASISPASFQENTGRFCQLSTTNELF